MKSVLFIIPAYNEAANIASVIADIRTEMPEADVVVVNDHSRDQTETIVRASGARCISQPFNMGYAAALQTGFKFAVRHGYDYVIQFDGDGQHLASEARKLYEVALTEHQDVVIGSRFMAPGAYSNSFFRNLGTAFFRFLIRLFCGRVIHDPTSGLQVLARPYFTLFAELNGFAEYPDANLIIELLQSGAKVAERPAKMLLRTAGESMHSGILKPIKYMLVMSYSILIVLLRRKKRFGVKG